MISKDAPINNKYLRLALLGMFLWFWIFLVPGNIQNGICRSRGVQTTGTINSIQQDFGLSLTYIQSDGTGSSRSEWFEHMVKYDYKDAAGNSYSGKFVTIANRKYAQGQKIEIKYLNSNPSLSCILNTNLAPFNILIGMSVVTLFLLFFCIYRLIVRNGRAQQDNH